MAAPFFCWPRPRTGPGETRAFHADGPGFSPRSDKGAPSRPRVPLSPRARLSPTWQATVRKRCPKVTAPKISRPGLDFDRTQTDEFSGAFARPRAADPA